MKINISALACLCALVLPSCASYEPSSMADDIASIDRIVHAAGELYGYDMEGNYRSFLGSNSLEGLENCGKSNIRAVELDFNFTSDGHLVCIHDWSPEYVSGIEMGEPMTYDEFMDSEIYWNFTPIDTVYAADFLENHPDSYIVTDIKDDFYDALAVIADDFSENLDRVIVQIYDTDQYGKVREIGFDNVILTLYMLPWEEKTDTKRLTSFAKNHPLVAFTFPAQLTEIDGFVDEMKSSGIPLFVHTVNGDEEMKKYFDIGIDGVYTDDV